MTSYSLISYLLSHTGRGALQLPLGKQISSDAPINELPLIHDKCTLELSLVSLLSTFSPRREYISGQLTAWNWESYKILFRLNQTFCVFVLVCDEKSTYLDKNFHRMLVSWWCGARKDTRVLFNCMVNAQTIFQLCVAFLIGGPALWINAIFVADVPFGVAESSHPQAFHVQCCARIHNQFAIIALCDRPILMSK